MVGDILQPTHLLFVLVVALLVLGPKRLPEVARTLGKGIRDFRGAISGETDRDEEHRGFIPRGGEPGHYETTEPAPPAAATAAAAATPSEFTSAHPAPPPAQPAPPQPAQPAATESGHTPEPGHSTEPAHPEQAHAPAHDAGHTPGDGADHGATSASTQHSQ